MPADSSSLELLSKKHIAKNNTQPNSALMLSFTASHLDSFNLIAKANDALNY